MNYIDVAPHLPEMPEIFLSREDEAAIMAAFEKHRGLDGEPTRQTLISVAAIGFRMALNGLAWNRRA